MSPPVLKNRWEGDMKIQPTRPDAGLPKKSNRATESNPPLGWGYRRSKRTLGLFFALLFLIYSVPVRAQTRVDAYSVEVRSEDGFPDGIQFYCLLAYNLTDCKKHAIALRQELTHYPISAIVPWSFVLVPSSSWGEMLHAAGGPSGSPAFTALHARETFLEDALFEPTALQRAQFRRVFHLDENGLFKLAVSHELGHILCRETNESKASICGQNLRKEKGLGPAMPNRINPMPIRTGSETKRIFYLDTKGRP
jgi:hypothetical protein